ncbi:P-loop containing nucleoside triphosphate hydrolase protein [Syncephalastrum racemosum]|uniref:Mitochondrial GTPase 1 n=1 Tax=Syncephalastrum racemosum TaxID=13706 RepID=A0A1X2HQ81_SYNRA|nr:P-loop containing nucleoside triphosphate hydrolase protein [Syncephalastrum racemosum]
MSARFVPRSTFAYDRIINWFPGHMLKGMRLISERLNSVDLVVEVRDARIPLASVNPNFEKLVGRKPRLVVYNKQDLADPSTLAPVQAALARQGTPSVFTSCQTGQDVRSILKHAAELADPIPHVTLMVVGMPNVGKSSLINQLRHFGVGRGKAAATGAQPGITRTVANTVKVLEHPAVYLIDTPGVMMPHIGDPVQSVRVALTGGIRDNLAGETTLVDYLLFELNRRHLFDYTERFRLDEPTNDVHVLLDAVARRIGAILKGGELDHNQASKFLLKQFRQGKFGRMTLDDVRDADTFFDQLEKPLPPSRRVAKKLAKLAHRKEERRRQTDGEARNA